MVDLSRLRDAEDKIKELEKLTVDKYKDILDKRLHPEKFKKKDLGSYSEEYNIFKETQAGTFTTWYEKFCRISENTIAVKIKPQTRESLVTFLKLSHVNATPEGVYAFTYLASLFALFLGLTISLVLFHGYLLIASFVIFLSLLLYLPQVPKSLFVVWRSKASDQLILAVIYMILYLDHTPNLELAVKFAADHLPPPLSLDFMKVLYDVEIKKFPEISDSLEAYIETWRDWNDDFIEAVHLIESSLATTTDEKRKKVLNKAIEVILQGTEEHMLHYAHNLQGPMETLHMLGVVLPVMGLVMLPMVSAFMGASIRWWYIVLLYNFALPFAVYIIGRGVLATRPSGSNNADIYIYMKKKYKQPVVNLFGTKIKARPKLFGLITGCLIGSPAILYFLHMYTLTGAELKTAMYSMTALLMSINLVVAIGVGIGVFVWSTVSYLIKTKKEMEKMEAQFTSAIFGLGNLISENIPTETAIGRIMRVLKKTEIAKLFEIIDVNLRKEGVGLREAIFDPQIGALSYYPSAIMKGVFNLLIEGAKKGPKIVSKSLTTISEYMRAVHKVDERLKDLLADTVSSMTMQVKMFIPVITGIVVGLAALTSKVLLALGDQLTDFAVGYEGEMAADYSISTQLLSIFQLEHMTPQFVFQLIVGIYVVQVIIIISYFLSGITYGRDDIQARNILSKNLFIGVVFYGFLAAATSLAFSALIGNLQLS